MREENLLNRILGPPRINAYPRIAAAFKKHQKDKLSTYRMLKKLKLFLQIGPPNGHSLDVVTQHLPNEGIIVVIIVYC